MALTIRIPDNSLPERQYIISVILDEILGIAYRVKKCANAQGISIEFDGFHLNLDDSFFQRLQAFGLSPSCLPQLPLAVWRVPAIYREALLEAEIPVLFGNDPEKGAMIRRSERNLDLGLDIFGSAFFLLSRYEEIVVSTRDQHDRFPAKASIAGKQGFLHRPLVNEYIELLWIFLKQLWPSLARKTRRFRQCISCDVDLPYGPETVGYFPLTLKLLDCLKKKRSFAELTAIWRNFQAVRKGDYSFDPYFTFDWIMDQCESAGVSLAFYFIVAHSNKRMDGVYSMDEPVILELLKTIHQRGHEIGLHASYDSFLSTERTVSEFRFLHALCKAENIDSPVLGGRQHYLRWRTPQTFINWEQAGARYDSTMGYAERAGFRTGLCHEYPVFDLQNRHTLRLRERPLIVMEASVIADQNMGMGRTDEALQYMELLKQTCRRFNGDFTLLWHNSHFLTPEDQSIFRSIIHS